MIFLIIKCVCFEKPPEKPDYGTILDKDPDLLSDVRKVDMNSIGVHSKYAGVNDSILSGIKPTDDSYLDVSRVSQDPVISQLLAPVNHEFLSEASDRGEMKGSEPGDDLAERRKIAINNRSKTVLR
jgi:hypothetical protein